MLTKEIIEKNVEGLGVAQIDALVKLSENDENAVIGARFGEVYRNLDAIIEKSTGVKRDGDEKTYNYMERAGLALKTKLKDAQTEIQRLTDENAKLTSNGDEGLKAKLEQSAKDLAAMQKQFAALQKSNEDMAKKHAAELFGIKVDAEVNTAFNGVKFRSDLPSNIVDMVKAQVSQQIKGMNPEFVDDGKGGKVIVYKDADGAIMRNPDKQLNPYTTSDFVEKGLKQMGVLAAKEQSGGGTQPPTNSKSSVIVDINGARTQTEAYDAIAQSLMAKGIVNGSKEFDEQLQAIWKDNNFQNLPIR